MTPEEFNALLLDRATQKTVADLIANDLVLDLEHLDEYRAEYDLLAKTFDQDRSTEAARERGSDFREALIVRRDRIAKLRMAIRHIETENGLRAKGLSIKIEEVK